MNLSIEMVSCHRIIQDADSRLSLAYDPMNRLTQVITGDAANPALTQPVTTLTATYDQAGNRLTLTDPTGVITATYDVLHRLTRIERPSLPVTFAYDALSRRTKTTYPTDLEAVATYDDASQLLSLVHRLSSAPATIRAQATYTYDTVGNRRTLTDLTGAHTFAYDALNRLTDATHPTLPTEFFTYDRVGNRMTSHLSPTHTHDTANRLLEDTTFTYTYDAAGNRATRTEKATNTAMTYAYDGEHQLIGVTAPSLVASYRYDGLGRRIEKTVNGVSTRAVYDQEDLVMEFDGTNTLRARWLHGPGIDEPLMMERDLNANGSFDSTERFSYHADGLGSTVALTDQTGTVVESYRYDTFGQPTILAPDGSTRTCSAYGNPFLFTGREYDCESGLYHNGKRTYDPMTGTFLQSDPIGFLSGNSHYGYAANNPLIHADPNGEFPAYVSVGLTEGLPPTSSFGALDSPEDVVIRSFITSVRQPEPGVATSITSQLPCPVVLKAEKREERVGQKDNPRQKKPPGKDVKWDKKRKRWADNDWVYNWDDRPHKKRGGAPHWDRGSLKGGQGEWSPDGIRWYPK